MNNETIINTVYEVQNWTEGPWETVVVFGTQEHAEECLHRTGAYEGLPPMITVEDPRWRIIQTETIERVTETLRVNVVLQDGRFVVNR